MIQKNETESKFKIQININDYEKIKSLSRNCFVRKLICIEFL
ncbi:hypothetical protein NC99_37700 [Sunxiuqinia dokdonensis]|uniref:Uncharacterized protein n=1 Tax=Sunxiuqinia dokdonensis TaxID=1409788 RepID=A0A0L8V4Q7_9BACT|nr:hypothetical protein NC99_37700 [Sunxiuqinia dokdonensis]